MHTLRPQRRPSFVRRIGAFGGVVAAVAFASLLSGGDAFACGGAFGEQFDLGVEQHIVIDHAAGVETYTFNPNFCGASADFGLILPIPATLESNPALAEAAILRELVDYTAPTITYVDECITRGTIDADGGWDAGFGEDGISNGATVINAGTVGMFDWTLLQADTAVAFTDWLDANSYPYDAATADVFTHYVDKGWFFVAFKVTAGTEAPPSGSSLCGDLGPLSVSFASAQPVIPTRIAAVGQPYQTWTVHVFADVEMQAQAPAFAGKRFAGAVAGLSGYPALAALAPAGAHLTELRFDIDPSLTADDIVLEANPAPSDYRMVVTRTNWVDCSGDDVPPATDLGSGDANLSDHGSPSVLGGDSDCECGMVTTSRTPGAASVMLVLVGLLWVRRREG